jgi:hypothetical protein
MTKFDACTYMDAAAAALALPIPPERRDAVAANLARLHALAEELLAWQPPPDDARDARKP